MCPGAALLVGKRGVYEQVEGVWTKLPAPAAEPSMVDCKRPHVRHE